MVNPLFAAFNTLLNVLDALPLPIWNFLVLSVSLFTILGIIKIILK